MLSPRNLSIALFASLLVPSAGMAEVKSYEMDVLRVLNTTTLTVTGKTVESWRFGNASINDGSNAHPTLETFNFFASISETTRTDVFAGVNSFVHTRTLSTTFPLPGQTGTGDTEGFVKWNPLSSWTALGGPFCKGSNELGNPLGGPICPIVNFGDEMTIGATIPSEVYDFPLWTFDAMGDFSGDSIFWRLDSNGSSNTEYFYRGQLQANVPAMSIVGFGILGVSMLFLGVRTLRKRDEER